MPPIAYLECSRRHTQISAHSPLTLFLSPEGAPAIAAHDNLLANGYLKVHYRVVLFNTGSGLKHADDIADAMHLNWPLQEAKAHA
jgi:threonine synthase